MLSNGGEGAEQMPCDHDKRHIELRTAQCQCVCVFSCTDFFIFFPPSVIIKRVNVTLRPISGAVTRGRSRKLKKETDTVKPNLSVLRPVGLRDSRLI